MPTIAFAILTLAAVSQDKAQKVDPFKPQPVEFLTDIPSIEVLVTVDQLDPLSWRSGLRKQTPIAIKSVTSAKQLEGADAVWLEDESTITVIVEGSFLNRQPIFHDLLLGEEVQNLFAKDSSRVFKLGLQSKDRLAQLIKNSILAREPELGVANDLDTAGKVWLSPTVQGTLTIGAKELRVNYDGAVGEPGAPEAFRSTFVDEVIRKRIQADRIKPTVVSSPMSSGLNLVHVAGRTAAKVERRLCELAGLYADDALRVTRRKPSSTPVPFQKLDGWKQSSLRLFIQNKFKDFGFQTAEEGLVALRDGKFKESFSGFSIRFQTEANQSYLHSPIQIAFPVSGAGSESTTGSVQ